MRTGGYLRVALCFALVASTFAALARAQPEGPVVVEYTAPTPECASPAAFQRLLETEVARSPTPARPWRFSVLIRRLGDAYEGTLTTETGVRTVTANRCDDVTASLALIVAMAEPPTEGAATPPPSDTPPPAPVTAPSAVPPTPSSTPLSKIADSSRDRSPGNPPLEWRAGARALTSDHGLGALTLGWLAFGSVELPWGFRKMMFEVGAGTFSNMFPSASSSGNPPLSITYLVLDTQACLIDLPLTNFGLSFLGCIRVAGASFKTSSLRVEQASGGAFWTGGGARFRWQTPIRLFIEVNLDAVYGTVSRDESPNPGWLDLGASLGVRL